MNREYCIYYEGGTWYRVHMHHDTQGCHTSVCSDLKSLLRVLGRIMDVVEVKCCDKHTLIVTKSDTTYTVTYMHSNFPNSKLVICEDVILETCIVYIDVITSSCINGRTNMNISQTVTDDNGNYVASDVIDDNGIISKTNDVKGFLSTVLPISAELFFILYDTGAIEYKCPDGATYIIRMLDHMEHDYANKIGVFRDGKRVGTVTTISDLIYIIPKEKEGEYTIKMIFEYKEPAAKVADSEQEGIEVTEVTEEDKEMTTGDIKWFNDLRNDPDWKHLFKLADEECSKESEPCICDRVIVRTPRDIILEEIDKERDYQVGIWSADNDNKNTINDWITYICSYATKGRASSKEFREMMVKVGALAVAAIEAYDRNHGHVPRKIKTWSEPRSYKIDDIGKCCCVD
jgi:hypothetical protein